MLSGWAAAILAGAAAWLLVPGGVGALGRLGPVVAHRGPPPRRAGWVVAAASLPVVASLAGGPRAGALAVAVLQIAGVLVLLNRRQRRRQRLTRARAAVVHAGELVAGLLRVGRVPAVALQEAAADAPVLGVAAAELAVGGDAAAALRRGASVPGQEGLLDLAAAWDVSVVTGSSLVEALDAASARLAADAEVARVVDAELAAARLGGRIMAGLPAVGIGLGYALGGDPLAFLTASPLGWVCLDVGVALACAGVLWIDRIAERAGGR